MRSALIALEVVGQLNKISVDTPSIVREYALENEPSIELLVKIAKDKGFKAGIKEIKPKELTKYPLPSICKRKEGTYAVILMTILKI